MNFRNSAAITVAAFFSGDFRRQPEFRRIRDILRRLESLRPRLITWFPETASRRAPSLYSCCFQYWSAVTMTPALARSSQRHTTEGRVRIAHSHQVTERHIDIDELIAGRRRAALRQTIVTGRMQVFTCIYSQGPWRGAFTCIGWQLTPCDPIW